MGKMIEAESLTKIFPGGITAVDGVSFTVAEGEIFGFLGPNGAGKSTTIAMLTTLLRPTGGTARVAGMDITRQAYQVRLAIGYVSQDLAVDDALTGYENLRLQAGFYRIPRDEVAQRITAVLEMVGLKERAQNLVETYSGGMRKRLDIACGLIHRPRLLFLDEPTLGLDIQTRREIWRYINDLREKEGMTIFVTTHYMEEADVLCDRIAIIDQGKIKVIDTPANLKSSLGSGVVTFKFAGGEPGAVNAALGRIRGLDFVSNVTSNGEKGYVATVTNGEAAIPSLFEALSGFPVKIAAISFKQPSLDDVFLHYTGREMRESGGGREEALRARLIMRRVRR
ncbi:ABC-2 type transport system ATP-binding protein [Thermodesulfitimonas autotrophica]|uniref:ABC-2 type transport system ATP-binding protein n=1 Tax=Thermodesulfitimonas autotrophica TaxID=1894989 RepID=A0A3N5BFQ0_9THEO|nr:ATP-binding cassette domain-containing protein [Thermodesulfitimonas autotrophica]RPF42881.1 ABC-2 type transport system ATP-binding protein [Thermodesulfitimonas autotrophica]